MKRVALGMVALIAMLAVCIATSAPAKADNLTVSLANGGAPVTCADGAACDTNGLAGAVTFTSLFGTVTVSLSGTGSGQPALPGQNLDLSYNLTTTSGAPSGTYTIAVSENNISGSGLTWNALVNGNQDTGESTAFNSWADTSNTLFGHGGPLCSTPSAITTASVSFSCNSAGGFSSQSFSLTEQVTVTSPAGAHNASGDAKLTASTPEPGSIMLLGSGLLGLAGLVRRKLNA